MRVLHLVGSPTNQFYAELSEVYARGCLDALFRSVRDEAIIAYVTPDRCWRFPPTLDRAAIDAAPPINFAAAMATLAAQRIDIALPQMFCPAGMTDYRALLEVIGIPYLGNRPLQMALTADKAKARAVVAAAGVPIPAGEFLRRHDVPTLAPPVVVKPATADNSDGVSLVRSRDEYASALNEAFSHADTVLVETYIELGREVRCGIVVRGGELVCLPLEEYFVDTVERPIRTRIDKLKRNPGDALVLAAKDATQSWIVPIDDPIVETVWEVARRCHAAIECRQYSLFDFRIDPHGRPWFLEAGLYCSYSPQSVLSTMIAAHGTPLDQFFADSVAELLLERRE